MSYCSPVFKPTDNRTGNGRVLGDTNLSAESGTAQPRVTTVVIMTAAGVFCAIRRSSYSSNPFIHIRIFSYCNLMLRIT